jgi:hypothetical protein
MAVLANIASGAIADPRESADRMVRRIRAEALT